MNTPIRKNRGVFVAATYRETSIWHIVPVVQFGEGFAVRGVHKAVHHRGSQTAADEDGPNQAIVAV